MLLVEADRCKNLNDLLFAHEDTLIGQDELKNRGMLLGADNVVLDIEGVDLVGRREVLDLAVGNGVHEGRLSGTVLAAQTVAVATLHVKISPRVSQKRLRFGDDVGKREFIKFAKKYHQQLEEECASVGRVTVRTMSPPRLADIGVLLQQAEDASRD